MAHFEENVRNLIISFHRTYFIHHSYLGWVTYTSTEDTIIIVQVRCTRTTKCWKQALDINTCHIQSPISSSDKREGKKWWMLWTAGMDSHNLNVSKIQVVCIQRFVIESVHYGDPASDFLGISRDTVSDFSFKNGSVSPGKRRVHIQPEVSSERNCLYFVLYYFITKVSFPIRFSYVQTSSEYTMSSCSKTLKVPSKSGRGRKAVFNQCYSARR